MDRVHYMLIILAEFEEWKAAYEAEHRVMFMKGTGNRTMEECTTSSTIGQKQGLSPVDEFFLCMHEV